METFSLYFHIPFCAHRCGYCDFNTYAGLEHLIPQYIDALCKEICWVRSELPEPHRVHTIFFGGGTPSLLPLKQIEMIMDCIFQQFDLQASPEISLEANPGTVSMEFFRVLKTFGFNRISLGMQTANPAELKFLERQHNFQDVIQAITWVRKAGISNINLDLIFGMPGQTLESWQHSISLALQLNPEHLAIYALSLEHGTTLERMNRRGLLPLINPDLAADMYEWSGKFLQESGYLQYEISNFAKHITGEILPGTANPHWSCLHNLQYWRNLPYLGFGAGAHGYANGFRTANVLTPKFYIERMQKPGSKNSAKKPKGFPITPASAQVLPVETRAEIGETLMMGLRLTREGILEEQFLMRFGQPLSSYFKDEIERFVKLDLIEWVQEENRHLRLTPKGRLLGNQVFQEFI